ncbi:unnamed protein product [Psylliodes chrysocephalus]|uniref:DUF659 domain-containing protein n=1 Tax=Psylliodes chrysocephalus TaxID=3402493 RepID=A0A9P0CYX4_9CUCU|nr:unnamed protein product [Psylliodes chrysocephala]
MLNPSYDLPSRKVISNNLIPQLYTSAVQEIKKQLEIPEAVTLTTDGWTSINNEGFLAITAHFIDENCLMKAFLLDCFIYSERHTAVNLASEIKRVLLEWNIQESRSYCNR